MSAEHETRETDQATQSGVAGSGFGIFAGFLRGVLGGVSNNQRLEAAGEEIQEEIHAEDVDERTMTVDCPDQNVRNLLRRVLAGQDELLRHQHEILLRMSSLEKLYPLGVLGSTVQAQPAPALPPTNHSHSTAARPLAPNSPISVAGLRNVSGAACAVNSVLQVLAVSPGLERILGEPKGTVL